MANIFFFVILKILDSINEMVRRDASLTRFFLSGKMGRLVDAFQAVSPLGEKKKHGLYNTVQFMNVPCYVCQRM